MNVARIKEFRYIKQSTYIMVFCVFAISSAMYGALPGAPTNLRVNDISNPVGTDNTPFFGWYVNDSDNNEIQSAYQILVASSETLLDADIADVWDSEKVISRKQNHIKFAGKVLTSNSKYVWKVKTWDRGGNESVWSKTQSFTVGLLNNSDWAGANWIKSDITNNDDYTYFRKQVDVRPNAIKQATVYISSVHKYTLYINGQLVGKGPAYHYPQYQYYNAYDVSHLIKAGGTNQFAIFNHWFGGGQGRPKSSPGVIMKVIVRFIDGTETVICTDENWKQTKADAWVLEQPHRNRGEGVGYVEKIDARKLQADWFKSDFDDSEWKNVTVIGTHPVKPWTGNLNPDLTRIIEEAINPVSIKKFSDGKYLVDFGKVYAGVPQIEFSGGDEGNTVNMLGGYCLDSDSKIDPSENQRTNLKFYAVVNGDSFTYEPAEYIGMRYLEIENSPMPITKSNCRFIARYSKMDDSASAFESSNETLNAVWSMMKHSIYTCAQEEFVDTPTREKGGFLGDGAIQSVAAMKTLNERTLTQRALNEFLQSMEQYWNQPLTRGRMNAVYPNNDGGRDIPDFTQAYLVWVWKYFMETGDLEFLAVNYQKFKDIADYVNRYLDEETGLITNLEGGGGAYKYGIIDWPKTMRFGHDMTDSRTVINALAYVDNEIVAKIASVLGMNADAKKYLDRAENLKQSINSHLINEEGVYVDGMNAGMVKSEHISQQANMLPLAAGIVPEANRQSVTDKIKELKMSSGMVTLPWLINGLGDAREGEHLLELYTNENWFGWARCLSLGATCTWESWDADTVDQSMSHAWGTSGLEGYINYILGVRPVRPQYEQVVIKPLDFGSKLKWAKGKITTDRGVIEVSWNNEANLYGLHLIIPTNVVCSISIPKGKAADPAVFYDGTEIKTTSDSGYINIGKIGSGTHTIIRKSN